ARDISIALEKPNNSSILNVIPVIIDSLKQQGKSQVNLRLLVGNSVILSRITRKSALQLNLKPGDSVYAQIKTAAICV
ncbi:TOBE domain-containing protein, partial [Porticoccaceae bacterium]|nr:TOBE domain-containing protein [Porticoccaceae bacterium]